MVIGGVTEEFKDYDVRGFAKLVATAGLQKEYQEIFDVINVWQEMVIKGKDAMSLYFYGANGSGKTFMAINIMESLKKIQCFRTTAIKLQQDFFKEWKVPKAGLFKGLLVIDEFGKEYKTKAEHSESIMEYILKYRSERKFLTIVISNADISFIRQRYGETVYSILRGKYIPIGYPETDFREISGNNELKKYLKNA